MHAESKISTQSVEQQTGNREEDVLPGDLDHKQLRDSSDAAVSRQLCGRQWLALLFFPVIGAHSIMAN